MNQELMPFSFNDKPVRVIMVDDEPWWVASDVCALIGLEDAYMAVSRLDDDEHKTVRNKDTGQIGRVINQRLNPNQKVIVVNEPGLYSLILRSDKPEAKPFKRWVTHEVLPVIRKHGAYITAEARNQLKSELKSEIIAMLRPEKKKHKPRVLKRLPGFPPAPTFYKKVDVSSQFYWELFQNFLNGKEIVTAKDLRANCAPELSAVTVGRIMAYNRWRSFTHRIGDQVLRVYRGYNAGV